MSFNNQYDIINPILFGLTYFMLFSETQNSFWYVRKKPSVFFSVNNKYNYLWSDKESESPEDLTGDYLRWLIQQDNTYEHRINEILSQLGIATKTQRATGFVKSKKFKLCLEVFDKLNETGSWDEQVALLAMIFRRIYASIHQEECIGINFKEVFLVLEGDTPPLHFRPGIDICVTSVAEYKKKTEQLSYQLGKAILHEFKFPYFPQDNAKKSLTLQGYHNDDYQTPLKNLYYFDSALTSFSHFYYSNHYKYSDPYRANLFRPAIFAFTAVVSLSELLPLFQYYRKHTAHRELTLIFKGGQYECALERQRIYEELLSVIKESKCSFIVQLLLITQDPPKANLFDLKFNAEEQIEPFQRLSQGAGYYLSSSKALPLIYRNMQEKTPIPVFWLPPEPAIKAHPGSYIYSQEVSADIRKSKQLTGEQLKSNIHLSITQQEAVAHQESVAQNEVINEQIQENYTQTLNQHLSVSANQDVTWDLKTNLSQFCQKLEHFALKKLPKIERHEHNLSKIGYLTQFYLKHHSQRYFYERLAKDERFRVQIAAKLFGTVLVASESEDNGLLKVHLPHHSANNIEPHLVNNLIKNIRSYQDGLATKHRLIKKTYLFGQTLYGVQKTHHYIDLPVAPPHFFSELSYQAPLNYFVLLTEEQLASLAPTEQNELIQRTEQLLALFQPHPPLDLHAIHALENEFLNLVRFYFPERIKDIARMEQFITQFAVHNEDNIKILIHIIISKHTQGLIAFFELLSFLEERSLLNHFYTLYFQYALTSSSVAHLLMNLTTNDFLKLAARTPVSKSAAKLPFFEVFAYNFLIFSAQNNIELHWNELAKLENFWKRLHAKFLSYCDNHEEEAQKLLSNLAQQLSAKNGLSIAAISQIELFYEGLELILDRAIEQFALKEQIDEIKEISLISTDAPYACEYNGFRVICPEMQIHSQEINPLTKTYAVSSQELAQAMAHHKAQDKSLKMRVFRYLGTQHLREDLDFYRKLYQATTQIEDATIVYLSELLCAYHAMTCTGNRYGDEMDQKAFTENFVHFLKDHNLEESLSLEQISNATTHFFVHLQQIPKDEQNGVQSLWSIWRAQHVFAFKVSQQPIPGIFLKKFAINELKKFLFAQKEILEKALPALGDDPKIAATLINTWLDESGIRKEHQKIITGYLKTLYPKLTMHCLLHNASEIDRFLAAFSSLSRSNPKSFIYLSLDWLITQSSNINALLCFIELLAVELNKRQGQQTADKMASYLLSALARTPHIYNTLPKTTRLFSELLEAFLTRDVKEDPRILLNIFEKIVHLDIEEAQHVFIALAHMSKNSDGLQFLNTHAYLSAVQLREAANFIEKVQPLTFALEIMEGLYEQNQAYSLKELNDILAQNTSKDVHYVLKIAQTICEFTKQPLLHELHQLTNKPPNGLKKLAQLHKLQRINTEEMIKLLGQPVLEEAIAQVQRQKYQENRERYAYNTELVKEQIAQIRLKSHETEAELPLDNEEQANLWRDYQLVMSYMVDKPIKIKSAATLKECTIYDLDENEFPPLFQALQERIAKGEQVHHNQLLLIALSAEALYRTTAKFPRSTQILTLLKRLHSPGNLIHEIKTGEGKSIIAAMHGVLLCCLGHTVDIPTENNELARNALEKFGPFYHYFGIPHGTNILTAQSTHQEYIANGVNYSTASNLALFRTRMALEKKALPNNPALVCDEIDAILTTTVQFRLAATLDPALSDTQTWSKVYQLILDFVKEEEIYLHNPCSQATDIFNLKNYFIVKNPEKNFLNFVGKISRELLSTLIESAMVAHALEENIDYFVVEAKDQDSKYYYAAPISASTKRPEPNVSYSDHVQQLLHTRLNNKKPAPTYSFVVEPSTETLVTTSVKNFFDYYRLNNGPIIGLTGTSGTQTERAEFYEQQGLETFSYPKFAPDRSENLGLVTAFGSEDHHQKIVAWITAHKQQNPTQPILLITQSPQATEQLKDFLAAQTTWKLQYYHGHEELGKSEEHVISTAGKNEFITLANQSLGRGTDIEPEHEQGLLVINTCTTLTPRELRQIQGRAARKDDPGQFISIIDAETIGTASDSAHSLAEAFTMHQHATSLAQQQARLKMRLLEEARHLMISEYVLKLRAKADKILIRQFGEAASIAEHTKFLNTLNKLNRNAENAYVKLLAKHQVINNRMTDEFLIILINEHQEVLDQWLPEAKLSSLQFFEPSIPLDGLKTAAPQLNGTTVAQLSALADFFYRQWMIDGHQKTTHLIHISEELLEAFVPYFQKRCSFKQALGPFLETKGYFNSEKTDEFVVDLKGIIDEMLDYAQSIPIVGRLLPKERIKKFLVEYLDTTHTQIKEKKWDEISLPTIDASEVSSWFNGIGTMFTGIKTVLTIGSILGGPIPFIVKQFIIPTIMGWIKDRLKQRFTHSKSLVAQILIGLDDIGNDLPAAISAMAELANKKEITVGWLLDQFGPLAKNKAVFLALSSYLELIDYKEYIPLLEALPKFLDALEMYRERTPESLLTVQTLLELLQHASRSELFLNTLENSPHKTSLERISQLDAKFIDQIKTFSLAEFLNLLKVIAHPNFFSLLEKLPPDTTYEQLNQWLENVPETVSGDIQQALHELLDYQKNPERIAEESKHELLNLRTTFSLTMEKFNMGLAQLKPQPFIKKEAPPTRIKTEAPLTLAPETSSNLLWWLQQTVTFALPVTILACSIIYLSITLALTGTFLLGWTALPYLKQLMVTEPGTVQKRAATEPGVEPPLSAELPPFIVLTQKPLMEAPCKVHQEIRTITDTPHGFFANRKPEVNWDIATEQSMISLSA